MAVISNGTTIADVHLFFCKSRFNGSFKTITVSSNSGDLSFVHGSSSVVFNDTYPIYQKFINSSNIQMTKQCSIIIFFNGW